MLARDPWLLPSAAAFLDEIEAAHDEGIAFIVADPAMPDGWERALTMRLRIRGQDVLPARAEAGCLPAAVVADELHCPRTLQALVESRHLGTSVIVNLSALGAEARADWCTFLLRFKEARERAESGVALVVAGGQPSDKLPSGLRRLHWNSRLRRLDVAIWADLNTPEERAEPLAALATALGVELCCWRLDLAAEIVRSSRSDLIDPVSWLERRDCALIPGERSFGGFPMRCPIAVLRDGDRAELERRVWRAHLSALFPWIEDLRQAVITRHRGRLRVDDHLRSLGVRDIKEIEFGALAWQLRPQVDRNEAARLDCLARIRNALAHGKPASPEDLELALKGNLASR